MRKPADLLARESEWRRLTALWDEARAGRPQLVLVAGPRQGGKTWLTSRFAGAAGGARYQFRGLAEPEEMRTLAAALRIEGRGLAVVAAAVPTTWPGFLEATVAASAERDVLLVLDEVPYFGESRASWARDLQAVWDSSVAGRPRRLMLVLVGSALRLMEQLIGSRGPLYGRAEHLPLAPFSLGEVAVARKDLAPRNILECYACTGGLPRFALAWRQAPLEANVKRLALEQQAPLLRIADELLHHDSLEGPSYRRILQAVASGEHRYLRIQRTVALRIEPSLAVLEQAGYLRKRLPLGVPPRAAKESEYRVTNPFFAFAWGPVERARMYAEAGDPSLALSVVGEEIRRHVAAVFEEVAREHAALLASSGELPRCLTGEWWTHRRGGAQLDVLGLVERRALFVGEAKSGGTPRAALAQLEDTLSRSPFAADDPLRVAWTAGQSPAGRRSGTRTIGLESLVADLRDAAARGPSRAKTR